MQLDQLFDAAKTAQEKAYAPYSKFKLARQSSQMMARFIQVVMSKTRLIPAALALKPVRLPPCYLVAPSASQPLW